MYLLTQNKAALFESWEKELKLKLTSEHFTGRAAIVCPRSPSWWYDSMKRKIEHVKTIYFDACVKKQETCSVFAVASLRSWGVTVNRAFISALRLLPPRHSPAQAQLDAAARSHRDLLASDGKCFKWPGDLLLYGIISGLFSSRDGGFHITFRWRYKKKNL